MTQPGFPRMVVNLGMLPEVELDLINKAAKGDQNAFRHLVELYQSFAYALAYRYTTEEDDAEDITQEAFIKIWKNLDRYDAQFPFKAWLGKIITNLCLDHLKSGRRKHESKKTKTDNTLEMASTDEPGKELEISELRSIVNQLAAQLTEQQRSVFILRDLEMFTSDEVCAMLNQSPGNLKSNLYYARLKIKQGLAAWYNYKNDQGTKSKKL